MKKLWIVLALLSSGRAMACDVCGCTGAAAMSFPGGFIRESQVGLAWQHVRFDSRHLPSILKGSEGVERVSTERFQLLMLQSRIRISNRFQLLGNIPVQFVDKQDEGKRTRINGLGDAQLGVSWQYSPDSVFPGSGWLLQAEYLLKVPTGEYRQELISEQVSRYMLPGTGSYDHFFRVGLQKQVNRWIFRGNYLYRLNGATHDGLQWGDRMQLLTDAGYVLGNMEGHRLLLNAGWLMEWGMPDRQNGQELPFSRYAFGQLQSAVLWRYGSWSAGLTCFVPVNGQLADGRVSVSRRFQIQTVFFF